MAVIHLLAAIRPEAAARYQTRLAEQEGFAVRVVTDITSVPAVLRDAGGRTDVLVVDNALEGVTALIRELRETAPRLLIVRVDEGADLSMPGHADDVSTDPFNNNDLVRRILRLLQERQTETLRADALPPVREVAKRLHRAAGAAGKVEAAVLAIRDLGFDLVAFYRQGSETAPLTLGATAGSPAITGLAPEQQKETTLVGWVAQNGHSRVVGPQDEPNYSLIKRGRLGAGACIPVGNDRCFGVLLACREGPDSISQEDVMVLALIGSQLAAALAREP